MNSIIFIQGAEFKKLKTSKETSTALLKQCSKITQCLMHGGQYAVVYRDESTERMKIKKHLTLEAASHFYNQQAKQ